jgi:hypothetical protein
MLNGDGPLQLFIPIMLYDFGRFFSPRLAIRQFIVITASIANLLICSELGAVYNFTNFSYNLTDLSYHCRGWFINFISMF